MLKLKFLSAKVEIHADCMLAVQTAEGCNLDSKHNDRCNCLSHLGRVVAYSKAATIHHVKAHCGQPWNETVDALAKEAAKAGDMLDIRAYLFRDEFYGQALALHFVPFGASS